MRTGKVKALEADQAQSGQRRRFIKKSEAARLIGISEDTVGQWCERGKLKFRRTSYGREIELESARQARNDRKQQQQTAREAAE